MQILAFSNFSPQHCSWRWWLPPCWGSTEQPWALNTSQEHPPADGINLVSRGWERESPGDAVTAQTLQRRSFFCVLTIHFHTALNFPPHSVWDLRTSRESHLFEAGIRKRGINSIFYSWGEVTETPKAFLYHVGERCCFVSACGCTGRIISAAAVKWSDFCCLQASVFSIA